MDPYNLIVPIFGGVCGLAGFGIKYLFDKRGEAESRRFADKREHYRTFILMIKEMAEGRKVEGLFWFEYSFLWLYAPDEVLRSANTVARILKKSPTPTADLNAALGNLLIEMRHDIGFKSSEMTSADYLVEPAPL
jgi:hypothetical protein